MTYEEVLTGIHSRKVFSSTASLERITRLLERLGNPQERMQCVHVAGTNGKGSTCALVESALRAAGFRVGLFTSPYLVDFRERIQVNREWISREELIGCYEAVMEQEQALEDEGFEPVNEFELVTALGFLAFARAKVDYAVIEVGLGGRFDATNVIRHPAVSCITSISLDHTAVLGNTVAAIAGEKAGIIKSGCPVVWARQFPEAETVLIQTAKTVGSPVHPAVNWECVSRDRTGQRFRLGSEAFEIPLLGRFQGDNAAAALTVCRVLNLPSEAIRRGFAQVKWPGRLQLMEGTPSVLIDAGHNPAGIASLCEELDILFPNTEINAVVAMMRDKDHRTCIPMVAGRAKRLIAATVGLPRSLPPEELAAEAAPFCEAECVDSVAAGIGRARELTPPDGLILICGSVYAAGEALGMLDPEMRQ